MLSRFGFLWMLFLLLASCAKEQLAFFDDDQNSIESVLTYEWSTKQDKDTTWLFCNQHVNFSNSDGTQTVEQQAYVKLWPEKEKISFSADKVPEPEYISESQASSESGKLPTVSTCVKQYFFDDGQSATAEIHVERFVLSNYTLPYVDITDVKFESATAEATYLTDEYTAALLFSALWQEKRTEIPESGAKPVMATYDKIRSAEIDELLHTDYAQKYVWNGDDLVLSVEKTEEWSISGTKQHTYSSPALIFELTGREDRQLEVTQFNFDSKVSSAHTATEDISANGWALTKSIVIKNVNFDNESETFSNIFEYPSYTASYTLDGRKFDFDLTVAFNETHQLVLIDAYHADLTTTAETTLLEHTLTQTVTTALSIPQEPNPEPEPDPDPAPAYGKIISCNVSAVFDPSELHTNGQITKKCISVRYEEGYSFGICLYDEDFPTVFTYVTSGYTGFNSAAMDTANSPYQLARAEDKADGIYWYSEDNRLLAAIDVITCKTYGWRNQTNGKYSYVLNGYDAKYSADRYTLTLTAPDGAVITFKSSALH